MRFRHITRKRSGEHIIVGHRLVSEFDVPRTPLDMERPQRGELTDHRGRYRFAMRSDGTIYERELVDTPEQIKQDRDREIQRRIRRRYSTHQELALLRRALIHGIDHETREYSAFVESVIEDAKAGTGDSHGD
ncbi:MAG: hypothetical protein ACLFS5_01820 [Spirochaetaceae bacterium]